jgi:hypothetical protein
MTGAVISTRWHVFMVSLLLFLLAINASAAGMQV